MTVEQLTKNVFIAVDTRGCYHGFVTTSEGVVLIDSPHLPSNAIAWRAEVERHGVPRYLINTEPHGDHWTGNSFFDVPVIAHAGVRKRILATDPREHVA